MLFWSYLVLKLSGPLTLKGMHSLFNRENDGRNEKKNYKPVAEIEQELRNVDLDDFIDVDSFGRYEFARCEGCDGPLLGHLEVKCNGKDGIRYRSEALRLFESWLKRVKGFRETVTA